MTPPSLLSRFADYDAADLARRRGSLVVSVVVPARDEQETVGQVVAAVHDELMLAGGGVDLVSELVVVDDASSDATAERAAAAGARVERGAGLGKGAAMDKGVAATTGDVVVFVDADVVNFGAHFVTGLVGPMLDDDEVVMVKAFYERPLHDQGTGGGRVTELVARPVVSLLFPELAGIRQPLAGETALRRAVLEHTALEPGYGVELGLLVDVAERYGVGAIAQVDLGTRVHRNRPLSELRPQATDVLRAALARAGAPLGR
ncbi:MAG TPA: glucosyl-3-phosphoglycerate synthase [Acidimicrobiales bacterium]|nr:glucosyl-3-phosphoglycerate synthase [Acidimicrobiales bacterium]